MGFKDAMARFAFSIDKNKPELLLGLGIVGIVAGGVMACRATLKVNDILDAHRKELEIIRNANLEKPGNAKAKVYIKTSMEFVKTYAPSVLVAGLGVGMICYSHHILSERNAALSATLTATSAAFMEYRERVKKEVGEEVEQMIFDGGHKEKVTITEFNEKGKEKTHEEEVVVYDKPPIAPYQILFDEKSRWWRENCPMANRIVVENVQKNANLILRTKGFITLAEVLEMLGFELDLKNDIHAKEYLQMGWREAAESEPIRFVDFGLNSGRLAEFGKTEDCAWLTFNVDPAPIWHTPGTKMGSLMAA